MSDRFYTPHPLLPGEFTLDGPEAHHLSAVRRFGPGDRVTLFNGDGHDYPAEVTAVGKRTVALSVSPGLPVDKERPFPLVIAAALPKGDRFDFLLEKLVELGATEFVPLLTARSVVRPKDGAAEKWERAVIEASKQCGRAVLMRVRPPVSFGELLRRTDLPPARAVLHPVGGRPLAEVVGAAGRAVAVGPEGGFTDAEVAEAEAAGWARATLGPRVLRVETAAVVAAAI